MLLLSTGTRNKMLGADSFSDLFADGIIKIYTGTAPASPDDAETGTLLVTITKDSKTVATKQKVTVSATAVNSFDYTLTLNGVTIKYTSDTDATVDEISAGLVSAINTAQGTNGSVNFPKLFQKFVVTDLSNGTGQFTIEAVNENERFYLDVGDNLAVNVDVEPYYGLHFDTDPVDGVINKASDETWSGVCSATGTAGYFRFVKLDDDGKANKTAVRMQGTVGTANADMIVTSTAFAQGATQTVDITTITMPAV